MLASVLRMDNVERSVMAIESVFESYFDGESGVWSLRRVAVRAPVCAARVVPARVPISGTYKRVVVRKRIASAA